MKYVSCACKLTCNTLHPPSPLPLKALSLIQFTHPTPAYWPLSVHLPVCSECVPLDVMQVPRDAYVWTLMHCGIEGILTPCVVCVCAMHSVCVLAHAVYMLSLCSHDEPPNLVYSAPHKASALSLLAILCHVLVCLSLCTYLQISWRSVCCVVNSLSLQRPVLLDPPHEVCAYQIMLWTIHQCTMYNVYMWHVYILWHYEHNALISISLTKVLFVYVCKYWNKHIPHIGNAIVLEVIHIRINSVYVCIYYTYIYIYVIIKIWLPLMVFITFLLTSPHYSPAWLFWFQLVVF